MMSLRFMKLYSAKIFGLAVILFAMNILQLHAQQQQKTFTYGLKLQGEASTDSYLPFWLYSNKHGIINLNAPGGNAILDFHKHLMNNRSGFDYGFGATFVGRYSQNPTAFFNQLYATFSYGAFELKAGRFYEQLGTVDPRLSMGSLAISQNATPLPKIKLAIPAFTDIPLTHGYAEIKGEIAHGWFEKDRIIHSPWLHQKSLYIRLGGNLPFRPYVGLTDAATWGGRSDQIGELPRSLSDFKRVFLAKSGGGADSTNGENVYKLGDHRGIWDFGFYLRLANIKFLGYRQYLYNDKDGLKLQNPDALTGLSVRLPQHYQKVVTGITYEYLYTKKQSGPAIPSNSRDQTGGRDDYYNNYLYRTGWTYEGQTIGNPLFLNAYNPQLNIVSNYQVRPDLRYGIVNNRIVAHHFGIMGQLSASVNYKLLATYSKNYGQYSDQDLFQQQGIKTDFFSNPTQWSLLADFTYQPFDALRLHWSIAGDFGQLYEDRVGVMLGIELLGHSSF